MIGWILGLVVALWFGLALAGRHGALVTGSVYCVASMVALKARRSK